MLLAERKLSALACVVHELTSKDAAVIRTHLLRHDGIGDVFPPVKIKIRFALILRFCLQILSAAQHTSRNGHHGE